MVVCDYRMFYFLKKGAVVAGFCKVLMMGVVNSEVDYKEFENGTKVAKFGLVSSREFTLPDGGSMSEVAYVVCDVYGDEATLCRDRLQKGMAVMIDGRLRYEVVSEKEYLWLISERVNFISVSEAKKEEPTIEEVK